MTRLWVIVPFGAARLAHNVMGGKQTTERLFGMDGSGLGFDTVELINAAEGFQAASNQTQWHADEMDRVLKPYAMNPEAFKSPVADEFRRLYKEIQDDLENIKNEAKAMSNLVDTAKDEYMNRIMKATGQRPGGGSGSGGGGAVLNALGGR